MFPLSREGRQVCFRGHRGQVFGRRWGGARQDNPAISPSRQGPVPTAVPPSKGHTQDFPSNLSDPVHRLHCFPALCGGAAGSEVTCAPSFIAEIATVEPRLVSGPQEANYCI